MTRSLSYHLRCRSEGEGKLLGEGRKRERTGGSGSTGSDNILNAHFEYSTI